ncbi:MAG: hypothetical protein ACRD0L_17785, partial [Acidimicrobiales bacterium]
AWARAGFVVAAPFFPLTSSASPRLDESDIVNQPADIRFVISSLLAADHAPGPVEGLIDPSAVGIAGHSDGGGTMAAVAFDGCGQRAPVRAAVIIAGAGVNLCSAPYFPPGSPPLLVVQGLADSARVRRLSLQLYRDDPWPKYLLALPGGTHTSPVIGDGPEVPVVERVTTDFFDATLKRGAGAVSRLARDGDVVGLATLTSANQGRGAPAP